MNPYIPILVVLQALCIVQGYAYLRYAQKAYAANEPAWQRHYQLVSQVWSAAAVVVVAILTVLGLLGALK